MAEHRPEIGKKMKNKLKGEAGNKCANPGCANQRVHIHHIREWAAYRTHDEKHMIAVCPACHDEIHYGRLGISDETLYQWKQIRAQKADRTRGHLYVEPGDNTKILLGPIAFSGTSNVMPFSLAPNSYVSISIEDEEILLVDLKLATADDRDIVRIRAGHYDIFHHSDVSIDQRPGAIRVTVPCSPEYVPYWLIWAIQAEDPEFIRQPVTIFDIEVLKPGLVKASGIWAHGSRAIRVTKDAFQIFVEGRGLVRQLLGEGEHSAFRAVGNASQFGVPLFKL